MIKNILEEHAELMKLKRHLDDNCLERYATDDREALRAILEEAVEYPPVPSKRLYMEEFNLEYNEMYSMTAEERRACNERSAKFDEKYDKYQLREYEFDNKYLYYDIDNLPSIITIKVIDNKTEDIFNTKNSKRFNSRIMFKSILEEIEALDPRVAKDVIRRFEDKIDDQNFEINLVRANLLLKYTEEDKEEKIEDYHESIVLLYELIDYLKENFKPESIDKTSKSIPKTTTVEIDEGPTSVHDLPEHILESLIEHDFVHYKTHQWQGSKALCTYFINRYYKYRSNDWPRIGSRMFGIKNMAQRRNRYKANKHRKPIGFEIIDEILEEDRKRTKRSSL